MTDRGNYEDRHTPDTGDRRCQPGTELLPCPFCGSPARTDLLPHEWGPGWVQCSACECTQFMSNTIGEAVARWNTRATPAQPAGMRDKIAQVIRDQLIAQSKAAGLFAISINLGSPLTKYAADCADLIAALPAERREEHAKIRHRGIFIERQLQGSGSYLFICHTGISKFLPDLYPTQAAAIAAVDAALALPAERPAVAGFTEAEGYASSLRQQARWIEESPAAEMIDADELRSAANFIERMRGNAQAAPEPAAWVAEYDGHLDTTIYRDTMERWKALGRKITPLYASPVSSTEGNTP